jgi:hypothetical protein
MLRLCYTSAFILFFITAQAHHSVQEYDRTTVIELHGIVSSVQIRNPHIKLEIRVTNDKGVDELWRAEGGSANAAYRKGLDRQDIRTGDTVHLAGWQVRSGRREIGMSNILLANGKEFIMRDIPLPLRWTEKEQPAVAEQLTGDPDHGLFRVWSAHGIYEQKAEFQYTEFAKDAKSKLVPERDIPAINCIPPGMPRAILNPYPIELIDQRDTIILKIEEWEASRIIDMRSAEIPEDAVVSNYGYSIGYWEGKTLVVHTEKVNYPYMDYKGTPMSTDTHITERFSVSEDGNILNIDITVTDPDTFLSPIGWNMKKQWVPNAVIMPFECEVE